MPTPTAIDSSPWKRHVALVLMPIFHLVLFYLLFLTRRIDNNRLTSWRWVMEDVPAPYFLSLILAGLAGAYLLSRVDWASVRHPLVVATLLVATAWGLHQLPPLIIDASRYVTYAQYLETYGVRYFWSGWGRSFPVWTDLPLVPFLWGLLLQFCQAGRPCIQVFTALLFAVTGIATWTIGRTLWDREVGFFAALLLLGFPYLLTQVPLLLVDVATMCFVTVTLAALLQALRSGNPAWALGAVAAMVLTALAKFSAWPLLSTCIVMPLALLKTDARRPLFVRTVAILLAAIFVLGLYAWVQGDVLFPQLDLLRSYQWRGLQRWGESYASTFLFQIHPFITIAALYACYRALKNRDRRFVIVAWAVLVAVVLGGRRIRYLIPVFPMLALMAAYGLNDVQRPELKKFIAGSLVLSSVILAYLFYFPFLSHVSTINMKQAAEALTPLEVQRITLATAGPQTTRCNPVIALPLFALFSPAPVCYQEPQAPPAISAGIDTSSLRFTWAYRVPPFYTCTAPVAPEPGQALVVITATHDLAPEERRHIVPEGFRLYRTFDTATGKFRYQTIVHVFVPR